MQQVARTVPVVDVNRIELVMRLRGICGDGISQGRDFAQDTGDFGIPLPAAALLIFRVQRAAFLCVGAPSYRDQREQ